MSDIFNWQTMLESIPPVLSRLHITLLIVIVSITLGFCLGALLAAVRIRKTAVLCQLVGIYISFIRGTPIIVQMFIVYYGLPIVLLQIGININRWDKLFFVLVTYVLNESAFMSEIIRAALESVPKGQKEAACSVGLTGLQAYRRIVIPQAFSHAVPVLETRLISAFQSTSLAFTLGIIDMIGQVQAIGTRTQRVLEGYLAVAVIFVLISLLLRMSFDILNQQLRLRKAPEVSS